MCWNPRREEKRRGASYRILSPSRILTSATAPDTSAITLRTPGTRCFRSPVPAGGGIECVFSAKACVCIIKGYRAIPVTWCGILPVTWSACTCVLGA
jgi:hypothetical protein